MHFKSDRQRKAVMAKLTSGKDYSYHNPQAQTHRAMLPSERRSQMIREQSRMNIKRADRAATEFKRKNPDFKDSDKRKYNIGLHPKSGADDFRMVFKDLKAAKKARKKLLKDKRFVIVEKIQKEREKDSDKDGVPDSKDCEPFNPKKQGKLHDIFHKNKHSKINKSLKSHRFKRLTPSGQKKVSKQLKAFKKVKTPSDFKKYLSTYGIGGLGAVIGLTGLVFPPSFALIALTTFGSGAVLLAVRNFRRFETIEELKQTAKKAEFKVVRQTAKVELRRRKKLKEKLKNRL